MTELDLNKYKEYEEILKKMNGEEPSSDEPSFDERVDETAKQPVEATASVEEKSEPASDEAEEICLANSEEEDESVADGDGKDKKKNTRIVSIFEWVESAVFAVVLVVLLFTFVFRIVGIDGSSMVPTLHDQDRVIISNIFYTPKTGDIVVLDTSEDTIVFNGRPYAKPLIKRVIAVGGQTVEVTSGTSEGQTVYVDGIPLSEDYVNLATLMKSAGQTKITVPEGEVFVMGDNRGESLDSRAFGCISEDSIVGRALVRIFPIADFDVLV